jgi:hypothetical protein
MKHGQTNDRQRHRLCQEVRDVESKYTWCLRRQDLSHSKRASYEVLVAAVWTSTAEIPHRGDMRLAVYFSTSVVATVCLQGIVGSNSEGKRLFLGIDWGAFSTILIIVLVYIDTPNSG